MDNCSVHVALKVNEFRIKKWNKILTIAPYYPKFESNKEGNFKYQIKNSFIFIRRKVLQFKNTA